jgi:hypothetical protein
VYSFIFYFFYKYFERRKDSTPRYRAILSVATTIGFHLFCLISIAKYVLDVTIPKFNDEYLINKLYLMPFALLLILLVYLYYNKKRTEEIIELKEKVVEKVFTIKSIISTILIICVPVIIGVVFIKMGE